MARPQKEGIDYFSLDCQFNDKVKLIQAEFGPVGIGILVKLWQKIYGEKGYYTAWDNDVALVFAQDCKAGANVVKEVVSACLRRGIFNREKFEQHHILTSEGIQERYAEATERRAVQKIDGRYLLIPMPENWVCVDNNRVNVDNNAENVDNNPQSKVNKSKVKEIHSFTHADGEEDLSSPEYRRRYLGGIGKNVVFLSDEQMIDLLDKMSIEEFDYYVGVVADSELKGHHYKKKTHYQAILDMAAKDRKVGKKG